MDGSSSEWEVVGLRNGIDGKGKVGICRI